MDAELIKKCKENPLPFGECSKEMQECFEQAGIDNCDLYFRDKHYWGKPSMGCLFDNCIYRLRPDYQPPIEPEVVKILVELIENELNYLGKDGYPCKLCVALSDPNFIGYEYADGRISVFPRIEEIQRKIAPIPKYVLFLKG